MNEELFKTDDTSLATFLSLYIEPTKHEWDGDACFWFFPNDEELAGLVRDFAGGNARVDPRAYSSQFSKRKKEMYQAQQLAKKRAV